MGKRQSDYHSLDIKQSLVPTNWGAGLTANVVKGTAVDVSDAEAVTLEVNVGDLDNGGGSTTVDGVWQESTTTTDGDFTDIAAADLLNGLFTQVTPSGENVVVKNGYIGSKQYIRFKATVTTGASTGVANVNANVIKGHLRVSV